MALTPVIGSKSVTTAGTAERLVASSKKVQRVILVSRKGNTGSVHIGDSTVDQSSAPGLQLLAAGDKVELVGPRDQVIDLYDIWVDVSVSDEAVDFFYFSG